MRIRKTYNGVVPNGKILNTRDNSQNDTYSCDYINKIFDDLTLTQEGLTTNGCTISGGGYCKIGKLVIVNMRVTITTAMSNNQNFVTGLPKSVINELPLVKNNATNGTIDSYYITITNNGTIFGRLTAANTSYHIAGVYISSD